MTRHRLHSVVEFVQQAKDSAVKENPKNTSSIEYRWEHTLRVTQYGRQLAALESANTELCMVACMMHDISRLSWKVHNVEHGRSGAKIARPFLQELGYADHDVENMCYAIAMHVDGKADFDHPLTPEVKVVNDADNIDRFSAYRLISQFRDPRDGFDTFITRARKQMERLNKSRKLTRMLTESGKKIFYRQLDLQVELLERLIADSKLTVIPEL